MSDTFNRALGNFITEVACADAIRHMTDIGLTVQEISARLDYPTPEATVAKIVWDHMIDKGLIVADNIAENVAVFEFLEAGEQITPKIYRRKSHKIEKVTYVKETGQYGRTSLRRVVEYIDTPKYDYIECDFGKRIYQDRERFIIELKDNGATQADIEHYLSLPWPLHTVYYVLDERMKRCLGGRNNKEATAKKI